MNITGPLRPPGGLCLWLPAIAAMFALCCVDATAERRASTGGPSVDLSGAWRIELRQCAAGEEECLRRLAMQAPGETVRAPYDLRREYPWFYGEAVISRQFIWDRDAANNLRLQIGGLASVDRVMINGVEVGGYGQSDRWETGFLASTWHRWRSYNIPAPLLRAGTNDIRIEFVSLDYRSGIFRGPVRIVSGQPDWIELFYPWIFNRVPHGILLLFLFNTVYFVTVVISGATPPAFRYFVVASFFYIFYSLQYIGLPIPAPYLVARQLALAGGFITAVFTVLIFLNLLGVSNRRMNYTLALSAVVCAALHFVPQSFWSLDRLAVYFHACVCIMLFAAVAFFGWLLFRRPHEKRTLLVVLPALLGAASLNLWDFAVRLHLVDGPELFNFSAYIYVLVILVLHAHELQETQRNADRYRLALSQERRRIARDLHDAVGADLTAILFQLQHHGDATPQASIRQQLNQTLRRLKDVVFLFSRDAASPVSLPDELKQTAQRLRDTGLVHAELHVKKDEAAPGILQTVQILRIFQEWIANTLRHSSPRRILIQWHSDRKGWRLAVVADGGGFSWRFSQNHPSPGSGLNSIAARAAEIQAKVRSFQTSGAKTVFVIRGPAAKSLETLEVQSGPQKEERPPRFRGTGADLR